MGTGGMRRVLAADIGGTKLAAGLVREDGQILARAGAPTPSGLDGEALYQTLLRLIRESAARASGAGGTIVAVGIGCGGPMRFPEGVVSPLNISAWRDFPLRARLEADFGLPAVVDNDAKAFALGEYWRRREQAPNCLLAMVVSTGVGGGIVERGRLLDGAHGNAGHIGHLIVYPGGPRCACGAQGCLEAIASGPSLARQARLARRRGAPAALPPQPTARDLAEAARAGDWLSQRLFLRAGRALGRGIASAAALLDLDLVVLGGGVVAAADLFLPALRRELDDRARLDFSQGLPVALCLDTVDAALVGAARLALSS